MSSLRIHEETVSSRFLRPISKPGSGRIALRLTVGITLTCRAGSDPFLASVKICLLAQVLMLGLFYGRSEMGHGKQLLNFFAFICRLPLVLFVGFFPLHCHFLDLQENSRYIYIHICIAIFIINIHKFYSLEYF